MDLGGSIACLERAALKHLEDKHHGAPDAAFMLAVHLWQAGQFRRAEAVLDNVVEQGHEFGADMMAAAIGSGIRYAEGRFADAASLATESIKLADSGQPPVCVHVVLAAAGLRQGDLRTAAQHARVLTEASLFGHLAFHGAEAAWVVAQVIETDRGGEAARDAVSKVANAALSRGDLLMSQPDAAPWLVRFMLSCGDEQMARRIAEVAQLLADRNEAFPTLRCAALHATGLLREDPGHLLEAAAGHAHPWAAASAREDVGVLLAARAGEHGKAVAALEQAMDEYHALGSALDVTRVKSRLYKLGVRYHYARCSVQPPETHRDLTDTEARIAVLVSQGLTNAQIGGQIYLSRHTVAFHLKNIFRKLGVSSRGELASLWFQLTAAPKTSNAASRLTSIHRLNPCWRFPG